MVHPDCAGVIPFGPVSWYGVASPCADSGFAGTMMSQLTLAAVVAVLVADGVAPALAVVDPLGHGAADAELDGVAVAVPVAAGVGVAVAAVVGVAVAVPAVGDAVPPVPWWPWWFGPAADCTNATGEAQLASADSLTLVVEPLLKATIAPTATASATGMPMATAVRCLARLTCRRRHEARCLLGMQSSSML
jgi:hypothetical protein